MEKNIETPKKKTMSEICHDIAESLISKYIFKTIEGVKDIEIWVYDEGIYKPIGKSLIRAKVEQRLGNMCKTHYVNEIINKIGRKTQIQRNKFCCNNLNLICVNNGVLNIKTRELFDFNPDLYFKNKIPIDYKVNAYCPSIFSFFNDVLVEEDIPCIQEWFGFQLYRNYIIKKAAIFRGAPDTGKTTFMNLLTNFVGEENISSLSLQLLAQGKWHISDLHNKYANICDDLSEKDITDSGTFKQVTGRSQLQAEYKFGDQFKFINYAKLSFACNKIPNVNANVDDDAYWNRWLIFDFNNIFSSNDKKTDVNIINKITRKEELSGLLNWALEGLDRLLKNGNFSYRRDWEENKRIMQGEASSVARFVNEALTNVHNSWVSNEDIYNKYCLYCELNGITVVETQRKFYLDIRDYCRFGKFGVNRNNVFGALHIQIKNPLPVIGMD